MVMFFCYLYSQLRPWTLVCSTKAHTIQKNYLALMQPFHKSSDRPLETRSHASDGEGFSKCFRRPSFTPSRINQALISEVISSVMSVFLKYCLDRFKQARAYFFSLKYSFVVFLKNNSYFSFVIFSIILQQTNFFDFIFKLGFEQIKKKIYFCLLIFVNIHPR